MAGVLLGLSIALALLAVGLSRYTVTRPDATWYGLFAIVLAGLAWWLW